MNAISAAAAAVAAIDLPQTAVRDDAVETTLLELVQTIGEITDDDAEVVGTILEMLRTGSVRLIGNFRGHSFAEA